RHREGFDRVYDFRENVAPREFDYVAGERETEAFFARKTVAFMGLKREGTFRSDMHGYLRDHYSIAAMKEMLGRWKEAGMFAPVQVEGGRETYLVLTEDVPLLDALESGRIPREWRPKETTTLEEVAFLSPLDIVSARGRAKKLFDFEYKWEAYTPAHLRRWGYYVMPILYGDDLTARLDPKLDRKTGTLHILSFHLEEGAPTDEVFASALGRGLARFAKMVGARKVDVKAIRPKKLQAQISKIIKDI
ncbi:MAG: crosslink repair DNA glycosylase YcaQ family protein, partial [Chloroflexota bacterium]